MNENLPIAIGFLLLCFGLFVYFIGFADWYDKRLLDCTPVSRCRSVALGPVVVSGKVTGLHPIPSLIAHLPSFISRVVVEQYRKSGKSSEWRTVHKRELRMPFYVDDGSGLIKVEPQKAVLWLEQDVQYSSETGVVEYSPAAADRATSQTESLDEMFMEYCLTRGIGTREPVRLTETNLSPGDPVFVYGSASPAKGDSGENSMIIRKTFWQTPYIMEGGKADMLRKLALRGSLRIAGGTAAVVLATGILARATAETRVFNAAEYVTSENSISGEMASLAALAVLGIFIYSALIYNGLVSLRNEVDRAFSNVDVLLQQRFDLIPNLVSVCKAYMEHESSVIQAVSASRGQWSDARGRVEKLNAAAVLIPPLRQLLATAENYPRLRANENFLQLQGALTNIEEQIADRRELYNSAVSLFNSRIQIFPDRIIAGTFRFTVQPFFSAGAGAASVPSVNVTTGA
jgi:LemA protein